MSTTIWVYLFFIQFLLHDGSALWFFTLNFHVNRIVLQPELNIFIVRERWGVILYLEYSLWVRLCRWYSFYLLREDRIDSWCSIFLVTIFLLFCLNKWVQERYFMFSFPLLFSINHWVLNFWGFWYRRWVIFELISNWYSMKKMRNEEFYHFLLCLSKYHRLWLQLKLLNSFLLYILSRYYVEIDIILCFISLSSQK